MNEQKSMFLIRLPYWLGIAADALWAIGLFFPPIFGVLTGRPDFDPDLQVRLLMGIGGSLMAGWTFLLLWAVKQPLERRVVPLLTAFPVLTGLILVALIGLLNGNTANIWILIKSSILFILMITSYTLSGTVARQKA